MCCNFDNAPLIMWLLTLMCLNESENIMGRVNTGPQAQAQKNNMFLLMYFVFILMSGDLECHVVPYK